MFFLRLLATLIILCFTTSVTLTAQDTLSLDARRAAAVEAAEALGAGGLVVRLPSNRKKIQELERMLTASTQEEQQRRRLQQELEEVRAETHEQNLLWMSAFRQHYSATPVLFMYDADTEALLAGRKGGFLLKDDLTTDATQTLPKSYLLTRINYTDPATGARTEAFIFSDARLNDLQRPALNAVKIANTGFLLNSLLAPDIAAAKRAEKTVKRLQDKVAGFLKSYGR